ncbi:hypothetical protein R6Z07M_009168 [Ovis aries]
MGDSKSSLGFLLLLLIVLFSGTSSDAHSLSYNFTIDPQPRDDQPWCEVQGEVDQKVFLSYDCGTAKIKYMSPLGEEVKNMSAWEAQTVTLRDTGVLLQGQMPDVTPEKHTDKVGSGLVTLQARMTCWREDDGHTKASWGFGFNGQLCLLFDSENGHWTVVHPGGRQMKEKWENDRTVTDFFRTVSMGDCWAWLQAFLVHWEKMLKSLAPPTTVPTTVQPTAATNNHITEIIFVVLAVFIITSIVAWILYKKRRRSSQEVWQGCSGMASSRERRRGAGAQRERSARSFKQGGGPAACSPNRLGHPNPLGSYGPMSSPRRLIPELTASRRAEPESHEEHQSRETKTRSGASLPVHHQLETGWIGLCGSYL